MLTKYKNVSCNKFIQLKRKEIQSLADSGHSLFDIYNYYKYEEYQNHNENMGALAVLIPVLISY